MSTANRACLFLYAASLATLTAVPIVRAQSAPAVAAVQTINHLQVRVSDPKRSYEFYMKLFGGHVIDTSKSEWTVMLGDTPVWFGLSTDSTNKPSEIDHVGIGVDLPGKPDALRRTLAQAFPLSNVRSRGKPGEESYDRAIYVNDPDGFTLALVSTRDAGSIPGADRTPAASRARAEGFVRFRSINHLAFSVTDREKTREFYSKLLGATIRDQNRAQITMTLPRTNGWVSLLTASERSPIKAGKLHHLGVGIDFPSDIPGVDAFRAKLKAAFPDGDVRSPGQPDPSMSAIFNRSIYVTDPDGLSLQLISSADDGGL